MKEHTTIELDEDDICQAIAEKYLVKVDNVSLYYERDQHTDSIVIWAEIVSE